MTMRSPLPVSTRASRRSKRPPAAAVRAPERVPRPREAGRAGPADASLTTWDYLLVTAANSVQAKAYEAQLAVRRQQGTLTAIGEVLVVPDIGGARIGSGGSTLFCLVEVLRRQLLGNRRALRDREAWRETLGRLRILILHAGGDSRRLPAYAPCGKLFVPLPGAGPGLATLFDRQLPIYLGLPRPQPLSGQIVIAAGDALVEFDPAGVRLAAEGITGLGCRALPRHAADHGVYRAGAHGEVELFLQKPTVGQQEEQAVIDSSGRSILDVGVMSFDAATAVRLLEACGTAPGRKGTPWAGPMAEAIAAYGLDFYREVACALGCRATAPQHAAAVRRAGSRWDDARLAKIFQALRGTAFHVCVPPDCRFLHWGTARHLLESAGQWSARAARGAPADGWLGANNEIAPEAAVIGGRAWIEGCRIESPVVLEGENLLVGADVDEKLRLPPRACLDVMPGRDRDGNPVFFVRCYGMDDDLQGAQGCAGTWCGRPLEMWLKVLGADPEDVWPAPAPVAARGLWNARILPAEKRADGYRRWLWMFDPARASEVQRRAWRQADRYSFAEMAALADHEAFQLRRARLRAGVFWSCPQRHFCRDSRLSAGELSHLLGPAGERGRRVAEFLADAHRCSANPSATAADRLVFSRMIHALGSAVLRLDEGGQRRLTEVVPGLHRALPAAESAWLQSLGLQPDGAGVGEWCDRVRAVAFQHLRQAIMASGGLAGRRPASALQSDEIVWGRAPARLDLCGGWTDTPPYSLEHGGCVLSAAVNLNGQPPIQAFARVIAEPVVRMTSIDRGTRIEIRSFDRLLDYRNVNSEFSLVKAALVLSGFAAPPPRRGKPSLRATLEAFGGGIELTTLAAVPKGSGLGTSSILGAVVLAVLDRVQGRRPQGLFHRVLQLEQAMTTGGGWQDQVGGVVEGVKLITTLPGMVPEPDIQFVPGDLLRPVEQDGPVLLYYTGITRLAKDILQRVVARWLDREPATVAALAEIRELARQAAVAMARRDLAAFGGCVDAAWRLNKRLDPDCSNEAVESLLARCRPRLHGAKLLGAGGGGFLLLVCRSADDARRLRADLDAAPPNDRARFFQFDINQEGLRVTAC